MGRVFTLLATALGVVASSFAQDIWPVPRGDQQRPGITINSTNGTWNKADGPETGRLTWYWPLNKDILPAITVDNISDDFSMTGSWTLPPDNLRSSGYYGLDYWYTTCVAATDVSDPSQGATKSATWVLRPTHSEVENYEVFVQFPSGGTHTSVSTIIPNALNAIYRVTWTSGGVPQSAIYKIQHTQGGQLVRLGSGLLFPASNGTPITVTLFNTVALLPDGSGPEEDPTKVIVTADAAFLTPPPAVSSSSPITINDAQYGKRFYYTRDITSTNPAGATGTAGTSGHLTCIAPPANIDATAFMLWDWTPSQLSNANTIVDEGPNFKHDAGFTEYLDVGRDFYGARSFRAPVTSSPLTTDWSNARWEPKLESSGNLDIYVWFPSSVTGNINARKVTYYVHYYEAGLKTDTIIVDQTNGGRWARIGNRSYPNDPDQGQVSLEVVNFSDDPADAGSFVQADAAMFVGDYDSSITVSPAFYPGIRVKLKNGTNATRDVIFVADQGGRVYMVDAKGVQNSGDNWRTFAYWAYPSIPNVNNANWKDPNDKANLDQGMTPPGAFLGTTVCVASVGGKDVVYIGNTNGRIYAIDCTGRGDYDDTQNLAGTAQRFWTYPDTYPDVTADKQITYNAVVTGVPAYYNNTVYFPTLEGRVYALSADGDGDKTTTPRWIWPGRNLDGLAPENPVGAIRGPVTVATASGAPMVVVGTELYQKPGSLVFSGYVTALNATGTGNHRTGEIWSWPKTTDPPIQGVSSSGPAYVPQVDVNSDGNLVDLISFGTIGGTVYGLNAKTGAKVWASPALGSTLTAAPSWGVIKSKADASLQESFLFPTAGGELLGVRARTYNSTKVAGQNNYAIQLAGGVVARAETTVADGFMYVVGSDGRFFAFSENTYGTGYANDIALVGTPPAQEVDLKDEIVPDPKLKDTIVKMITREDYLALRQLPSDQNTPITPYQAKSENIAAIEWGQRIYLMAYNFDVNHTGTVTFQLKGPSNTVRVSSPVRYYKAPGPKDPQNAMPDFSLFEYLIEGNRQNPYTPGEQYWFEATVQPTGTAAVGPFKMAQSALPIANPLSVALINPQTGLIDLSSIIGGVNPTEPANMVNGSGTKVIVAQHGDVSHGQHGTARFAIADRSLLVFNTGRPLRYIMGLRSDLLFSGGANAVIKPLPWEVPPVGYPNPSPDYPDIDRRNVDLWTNGVNGFGSHVNIVTDQATLPAPTITINVNDPNPDYSKRQIAWLPVDVETQVPLYQPANMADGYNQKIWIYVDLDSDRKLTGVGTSVSADQPTSGAEAYRTLNDRLTVPPDEKLSVVEPTVDLGQLSAGSGFTPQSPSQNGSKFYPSTFLSGAPITYDEFFKSFTVESPSNVNMLNLRVASILHNLDSSGKYNNPPFQPVAFFGDSLSPYAWLGADQVIVSNLDPRFNAQVTLHKPRPGDRSPTSLRIPDAPYGTLAVNNQPPTIGVGIPIGQPVGTYSQFIRVYEDSIANKPYIALDWEPSTGRAWETITEPSMKLKFTVKESRLTTLPDAGTMPMYDFGANPNRNFRAATAAPAAYRDAKTGALVVAMASQRDTRQNTDKNSGALANWALFTGVLGWSPLRSATIVPPPLGDLFHWTSATKQQWFTMGSGPYPTKPTGTTSHYAPVFPVNITTMPTPYMFWDSTESTIVNGELVNQHSLSYAKISSTSGQMSGTPIVIPAVDSRVPMYRPIPIGYGQKGGKLFWYGGTTGRYGLFVNETTDLASPSLWRRAESISVPRSLISAKDPYPVPKLNGDIDLVYSGVTKDRNTNEIFMATYGLDSDGNMEWDRPKAQGKIDGEVAVPEHKNGTVWRTRGIDWVVGERNPGISILVNGKNILGAVDRDRQGNTLRFVSTLGGYAVVDPVAGTITFPNMAPGAQDVVQVTYTPRTVRLTPLGNVGGHTEPVSFIDTRRIYDLTYSYREGSNNKAGTNNVVSLDRYWVLYKRHSTGAGQSTTLYMQTYRPGVQLPFPMNLPVDINFSGAGFATVDPIRGRIYFRQQDVGHQISITYMSQGSTIRSTVNLTVTWIPEMDDTAVPIEKAISEGEVTAFADPVVNVTTGRPDFIWLFWSSTRNGASDVYFETVSPRFDVTPIGGR